MSSEDGSDSRQRTVAELLAQHGAAQSNETPRRRRRRDHDGDDGATSDTAPQAIIDRVRSDTGSFPPVQEHPPTSGGGHAAREREPVHESVQEPIQAAPSAPTVDGSLQARLAGAAADPHTEQLPVVPGAPPGDDTPADDTPAPRGGEPPAGLGWFGEDDLGAVPGIPGTATFPEDDPDEREGGEEPDEAEDEAGDFADSAGPGSTREWVGLIGLITGGVVGGAAVWLGFDWLWGVLPAAALIVALVVIGVMVWVVRRIRHVDDPQTTVLAVLVGLVVTVSPAALLLLKR